MEKEKNNIINFPTKEERKEKIFNETIEAIKKEFGATKDDKAPEKLEELRKRWIVPTEKIVEESVREITKADPQFFLRNGLNLDNMQERLRLTYKDSSILEKRYGGDMNEMMESLSYKFNVYLDHLAFYVTECPSEELIQKTMDRIKSLLDGTFFDEPQE